MERFVAMCSNYKLANEFCISQRAIFPIAINSGYIYRAELISYRVDEQTSDFQLQIFRAVLPVSSH